MCELLLVCLACQPESPIPSLSTDVQLMKDRKIQNNMFNKFKVGASEFQKKLVLGNFFPRNVGIFFGY